VPLTLFLDLSFVVTDVSLPPLFLIVEIGDFPLTYSERPKLLFLSIRRGLGEARYHSPFPHNFPWEDFPSMTHARLCYGSVPNAMGYSFPVYLWVRPCQGPLWPHHLCWSFCPRAMGLCGLARGYFAPYFTIQVRRLSILSAWQIPGIRPNSPGHSQLLETLRLF